jgi:hypothetical protein
MWIETKELPESVRDALNRVSYGRRDVEVRVVRELVMSSAGSRGRRAFALAVNLSTGEIAGSFGSWGGENMFSPRNLVDRDHQAYQLPPNGVVVLGSQGYPQTFCTLYVSPDLMDKTMLPPAAEELTGEELDGIYAHACIKGGAYRREELRRRGVRAETLVSLVQRGYLSENRAGAHQVTTTGRNALGDYRGR